MRKFRRVVASPEHSPPPSNSTRECDPLDVNIKEKKRKKQTPKTQSSPTPLFSNLLNYSVPYRISTTWIILHFHQMKSTFAVSLRRIPNRNLRRIRGMRRFQSQRKIGYRSADATGLRSPSTALKGVSNTRPIKYRAGMVVAGFQLQRKKPSKKTGCPSSATSRAIDQDNPLGAKATVPLFDSNLPHS